MSAPAPDIAYTSTRLIGIELELDSGNTEFRAPAPVRGWSRHTDGSLHQGYEYVLEPPLRMCDATPTVNAFCAAVETARTNIGTKGGFHIHVQCADYTYVGPEWWNLVQFYRHFQPVIDKMVGPSRVNTRWAPPYASTVTRDAVLRMFHLDEPAQNRGSAKSTRCYSVVNLAMMRCSTPAHRTVEFRQLSPSRRPENVLGWAKLLCSFVDIAACADFGAEIRYPKTLDGLCAVLDARFPGQGLDEWVRWRYEYMNEEPTPELIQQVSAICRAPHGIHHISRTLNINLMLAKRAAEHGVRLGTLRKHGVKYVGHYDGSADLPALEEALMSCLEASLAPAAPAAPEVDPLIDLESTLTPEGIAAARTAPAVPRRARGRRVGGGRAMPAPTQEAPEQVWTESEDDDDGPSSNEPFRDIGGFAGRSF